MNYQVIDRATGDVLVTVIELSEHWTNCHRCNAETPVRWSLPVNTNGDYVGNDYAGEWGGVPACQPCYDWHQSECQAGRL